MHFPLFFDISQKNILVVGGGAVADRRIHTLLPFTGQITVIAPEYTDAIRDLADQGQLQLLARTFLPEDLTNRDIVLAATDDVNLNRAIALLCRNRKIPVNVSSDQSLCDFQFPSIVSEGDVVIGINASGKNHHLVKETRQKIEGLLCETSVPEESAAKSHGQNPYEPAQKPYEPEQKPYEKQAYNHNSGRIRGIGIDTANIDEIRRLLSLNEFSDAFRTHTFTPAEISEAPQEGDVAEYYATRFAAKEAVFKAVGHLMPEKTFDFRIVETLHHRDGSPYVNHTEALDAVLKKAGVGELLISMTTEDAHASAFVVALG